MYTHICTHTHIHPHLSVYMFSTPIYAYWKSWMCSLWYFPTSHFRSNTTGLNSNFLLSYLFNSLPWRWEIWFPLSLVSTFFDKAPCMLSASYSCHDSLPHMDSLLSLLRLWIPTLSQLPNSEAMSSSWSGSDSPYQASPPHLTDVLLALCGCVTTMLGPSFWGWPFPLAWVPPPTPRVNVIPISRGLR